MIKYISINENLQVYHKDIYRRTYDVFMNFVIIFIKNK